jgi:hypothetical protein
MITSDTHFRSVKIPSRILRHSSCHVAAREKSIPPYGFFRNKSYLWGASGLVTWYIAPFDYDVCVENWMSQGSCYVLLTVHLDIRVQWNQLDALCTRIFSLFSHYTSTRFGLSSCPSSGGNNVYMCKGRKIPLSATPIRQQLVHVLSFDCQLACLSPQPGKTTVN